MSIKNKFISGSAWLMVANFFEVIVTMISGIFLARLLLPSDFGIMGMVVVFYRFGVLFRDFGLNSALINHKDLHEEQIHTVFWLNVGLSIAVCFLFLLMAPFLAVFYRQPLVAPICRFVAWTYILAALTSVPMMLLYRKLAFRDLAVTDMASLAIAVLCTIFLAKLGWGVWSLVSQLFISSVVRMVFVFCYLRWIPKLSFDFKKSKALFHFGLNQFGSNVMNFWSRNMDNMMVGRFMGAEPLGIYSRSYSFMMLPMNQLAHSLAEVMFPVFSSMQVDKSWVRLSFLRVTNVLAGITCPLMVGLLVTARPLILTLYTEKWKDMIPLVQVLALSGLLQTLIVPMRMTCSSLGKARHVFKWDVFSFCVLGAAIIAGVLSGQLQWLVWFYFAGTVIFFLPFFSASGKLIDLTLITLFRTLAPVFMMSLTMAMLVWFLGQWLPAEWYCGWTLITEIIAGILAYVSMMLVFKPKVYMELKGVFQLIVTKKAKPGLTVSV